MADQTTENEVARIRSRLAALAAERSALAARLADLSRSSQSAPATSNTDAGGLTAASERIGKVALFRRLFAGRTDVFPLRWENTKTGRSGYAPACANEWVKGICGKPQVKCGECLNQAFIPVSGHVSLLPDETCWFLAVDFDGDNWARDALAYMETCRAKGVPAALERSRSGNGGHVWIFFCEPVSARDARRLGALLVTETMERHPEIGFSSYDRFFPSQDTMPAGGFGNLIALPLQRHARERGNSVFVNESLQPYEDQWAFLSSLPRISRDAVAARVGEAEACGRVLGVRMPVEDEDADEPWRSPPSRARPATSSPN